MGNNEAAHNDRCSPLTMRSAQIPQKIIASGVMDKYQKTKQYEYRDEVTIK